MQYKVESEKHEYEKMKDFLILSKKSWNSSFYYVIEKDINVYFEKLQHNTKYCVW